VRSLPEFVIIAVLVTLTPGPATATVLRVAARDGRTVARGTILGNSTGVLIWGVLSAAGVTSLILASQVAFDVLRGCGAAVLIFLGVRSLLARHHPGPAPADPAETSSAEGSQAQPASPAEPRSRRRRDIVAGWRTGFISSLSNPKLAVFFIALFPQFLTRGNPVLPYALGMAAAVVVLDIAWFSALTYAMDKAKTLLRPRVQRIMERVTGAVMIGLGVRLALESR
jgi:threonine/homoserine/homoserine lactone efflux protein